MREETFVTDQEAEASNYLDPISLKPLQAESTPLGQNTTPPLALAPSPSPTPSPCLQP